MRYGYAYHLGTDEPKKAVPALCVCNIRSHAANVVEVTEAFKIAAQKAEEAREIEKPFKSMCLS